MSIRALRLSQILLMFSVLVLLIAIPVRHAAAVEIYDTFSTATIDAAKWNNLEFVREVQGGKLFMTARALGNRVKNNANLVNPGQITYLESDVAVSVASGNVGSLPNARVTGYFYNDGRGTTYNTTGSLGETQGSVRIANRDGVLVASWAVARCDNFDCSVSTMVNTGDFAAVPVLNQTYKLSLNWDAVTKTFTFKVDSETLTYVMADAVINPPVDGWKSVSVDARVPDNSGLAARITATFDNVVAKNSEGATLVSDGFSSGTLSGDKWISPVVAREIKSGRLRLKQTTNSAIVVALETVLGVQNPQNYWSLQAKVTPTVFSNTAAAHPRLQVQGRAFNTLETPGATGHVDDVAGRVQIGGTGTQPVAQWYVVKYTDPNDTSISTNLGSGTFTTPVALNQTYTAFVAFDGTKFTFRFNNEEQTYTPAVPIAASPRMPSKVLQARITQNGGGGKAAAVDGYFDDVILGGQQVFSNDTSMTLTCPASATVGQQLKVTVALENTDCAANTVIARFAPMVIGNSSGTLAGAGIYGPYNRALVPALTIPHAICSATCTPNCVLMPGLANPVEVVVIDPVPPAFSGTAVQVMVDALTPAGESFAGRECMVPIVAAP